MGEYEQLPEDRHRKYVSKAEPKKGGAGVFVLGLIIGLAIAIIAFGIIMAVRSGPSGLSFSGSTGSGGSGSVVSSETTQKLKRLEDTINKRYYWSDDVTTQQKQNGLYKGLLNSLNDPYSVYYTPEELNDLTQDLEGVYYGIGAYVSQDPETGNAVIAGVIKNSPAEEAKLQEGDIIFKVDDEDMTGLDLDTVVSKIRGEEGTTVHLTLVRNGEAIEQDIVRARVDSPTVSSEMLEDDIGYLQITQFDEITTGQFTENLQQLRDQGMKAMILDLRGNPGGSVNTVTDIAGEILPEGLVFYMEDKNGKRDEYTCDGANWDIPLVVLVNEYSASASEILAGAIQDSGVGILVGNTTFGKGIVQEVIDLGDGSAVKLTIASYYTRNGRDIHKKGIDPDIEVDLDADAYLEDGTDTQLDKAIEVIKEQMK